MDRQPGLVKNHFPPLWVSGALLLILLVGGFLRFHALGEQSFWFDEAYTWNAVVRNSWRTMWGVLLSLSNVLPLPYILTKLALPFFGMREFGLRAPAAFFGWLAIPVTYRLGRAMFGQGVGLAAAALVAFSPFAVWYARDARPYGLYLFLSALVLWGFWRAERGRGWGMFIASSAALYVTHYLSALFVYAQAAYLLTHIRRQPLLFRRWALAQAAAVLPVSGWIVAFLAQRRPLSSMSWIPPVSLFTPLQTVWNFVSADAARWTPLMVTGLLILLALMGWGARSRSPSVQLLLWWFILPLVTAWVFSLRLRAYVDRFFEPAILPVALLSAAGLIGLPRSWRLVAVSLALAGMLFGSARLFSDPAFTKEDWRGAARLIEAEGLPVGVPDPEAWISLLPYVSPQVRLAMAATRGELSARLAEGPFVLVLRSPHESAHAFTKSAPFDPLTEGADFFLQWHSDHPDVPLEVHPFTGLALVVIGSR